MGDLFREYDQSDANGAHRRSCTLRAARSCLRVATQLRPEYALSACQRLSNQPLIPNCAKYCNANRNLARLAMRTERYPLIIYT